jgi:plasmid stabilization system protein ParE
VPAPFQLTEDATRDLEQVAAYLSQHSEAAALRLADDFENAFRFLAQWPAAGHLHPELGPEEVRFWTVSGYTIAYRSDSVPLLILSVIHGSRDVGAEIAFRRSKS